MRGYCAIGSDQSAAPPISVIATLSTVATMGRSMKKRDSMAGGPSATGPASGLCWLPDRRRLTEGRHGYGLDPNRHVRAYLLDPADQNPVVGAQSLGDHAQAVLLERTDR